MSDNRFALTRVFPINAADGNLPVYQNLTNQALVITKITYALPATSVVECNFYFGIMSIDKFLINLTPSESQQGGSWEGALILLPGYSLYAGVSTGTSNPNSTFTLTGYWIPES